MAWTHIQGNSAHTGSSATGSVVLASLPTTGNLVCVAIEGFNGSTGIVLNTVKDSNNNSYTITPNSPSAANEASAGGSWLAYLLSAPANASKTITATFSASITDIVVWADEFHSSVGGASFDNDKIGNQTATTNTIVPSIVIQKTGSLLYALGSTSTTATGTSSPWTLGSIDGTTGGINAYDLSASAPTEVRFSASSSSWDNMAMAFYEAGASPLSGFFHVIGASIPGASQPSSGTTATVVIPQNPRPGDLVCVGIMGGHGLTLGTVKDSNNNSYTITPNSPSSAHDATAGSIWLAYLLSAPANATGTITATFSAGTISTADMWADEFYMGSGASAVFDKDAVGSGSTGPTINTPSITPTQTGELLFAHANCDAHVTAINGSWIQGDGTLQSPAFDGAAYILSSSSGATALNFTENGSAWDSMAMAFSLSAGGAVIFQELAPAPAAGPQAGNSVSY
jgi:hypothetical protein